MARIKTYDLDATITNADKIIGTDGAEGANNATKNFTVSALKTFINADVIPYKSYVALLNQSGTDDPTDTELSNTTNYTYTWSRGSGGEYSITASGNAFTENKTIVFLNGGSAENNHDIAWNRISDTEIQILTHNSDGKLTNASFEVRIYT